MIKTLKKISKSFLWRIGVLPHSYLLRYPFKVYERKILDHFLVADSKAIVLDLGCGNGTMTFLIAGRFKKIIGIDPDSHAIDLAREKLKYSPCSHKIEFFNSKLGDMHIEPGTLDGVVSYCVLEHISDYEQVLRTISKVVKPGGWVLLSVDSLSTIVEPALKEKHRNDHHVVKYFSIADITELLVQSGFESIVVEPRLKSKYSEYLFKIGIKKNFRFSHVVGFVSAILLTAFEKWCRRSNEGLFLVVLARAPIGT